MNAHTFHIPVMGIAFSIDTPIKVAHYGINSVISIIEDELIENVRKVYSSKYNLNYEARATGTADARAKRITAYLNLVKQITEEKFRAFKENCSLQEAEDYFELLPDTSPLKMGFLNLKYSDKSTDVLINYARSNALLGDIDVNIMTKIDKVNYKKGKPLSKEYNDAHASLRGFAKSDLRSSLVLSAGLNPSLYSYMEVFDDFYPDESGSFKKKITLKVSDYRSALIQGKFLAKKGLWISEFRIESGLNCGGHAFATDGYLMGPILEEFKQNKAQLTQELYGLYCDALIQKNKPYPEIYPEIVITAQGGVGTAEEHAFLLEQYNLDSVGWGSPFLLVPEVTCVDDQTRSKLKDAQENDIYLSGISPLGVPFHNLRNNSKDLEKDKQSKLGKPGSPCIKKHLSFNTEYTEKPICTASRKYQQIKIKELKALNPGIEEYQKAYDKITEKTCLCTGLGTPFLINNNQETHVGGSGVSVCPGPNIAYFDKLVSLNQMIDHIYGRTNIISRTDRPHMFIKELTLYVEHLKGLFDDFLTDNNKKTQKRLTTFVSNLKDGISYYQTAIQRVIKLTDKQKEAFEELLFHYESEINKMSYLIVGEPAVV
jgi:hypothetical protein